MKAKWGNFEQDREALHMQYVNRYCNDEARERIEPLRKAVLKIAEDNKYLSHPEVKAMCFDYLTKNAEFTAKMPNRAKLIEGLLGLGGTN